MQSLGVQQRDFRLLIIRDLLFRLFHLNEACDRWLALLALILANVEDGKVKRLDLCGAPSPHSASRTSEYPGRG
jgi:hypothetical protein